MRLPRNVSGKELARLLGAFGYRTTRQSGSHIRVSTTQGGEHHVTVPNHDSLRVGTLSGILADVGEHVGLTREELSSRLFG